MGGDHVGVIVAAPLVLGLELAPGVSLDEIRAKTEAGFRVAPGLN